MRVAIRAVLVALVAIVIAGCGRAAGVTEPEPPPPPPPPGIEGSWSWSTTYTEDGRTETESLVLTFAPGGRFIEAWRLTDVNGNETGHWFRQGGWSATDTVLTKSYHDPWHDDGVQAGMVDKAYYWADDEHSAVYVQGWFRNDAPGSHFTRLERVSIPPINPVGTWTGRTYWEERDIHTDWTIIIGADGSFEFREEADNGFVAIITANATIDLDNHVINLTGIMESEEGGPFEQRETGVGRVAFAPAHGGSIRVSPLYDEPPSDNADMWPYGHYWLRLTKQS